MSTILLTVALTLLTLSSPCSECFSPSCPRATRNILQGTERVSIQDTCNLLELQTSSDFPTWSQNFHCLQTSDKNLLAILAHKIALLEDFDICFTTQTNDINRGLDEIFFHHISAFVKREAPEKVTPTEENAPYYLNVFGLRKIKDTQSSLIIYCAHSQMQHAHQVYASTFLYRSLHPSKPVPALPPPNVHTILSNSILYIAHNISTKAGAFCAQQEAYLSNILPTIHDLPVSDSLLPTIIEELIQILAPNNRSSQQEHCRDIIDLLVTFANTQCFTTYPNTQHLQQSSIEGLSIPHVPYRLKSLDIQLIHTEHIIQKTVASFCVKSVIGSPVFIARNLRKFYEQIPVHEFPRLTRILPLSGYSTNLMKLATLRQHFHESLPLPKDTLPALPPKSLEIIAIDLFQESLLHASYSLQDLKSDTEFLMQLASITPANDSSSLASWFNSELTTDSNSESMAVINLFCYIRSAAILLLHLKKNPYHDLLSHFSGYTCSLTERMQRVITPLYKEQPSPQSCLRQTSANVIAELTKKSRSIAQIGAAQHKQAISAAAAVDCKKIIAFLNQQTLCTPTNNGCTAPLDCAPPQLSTYALISREEPHYPMLSETLDEELMWEENTCTPQPAGRWATPEPVVSAVATQQDLYSSLYRTTFHALPQKRSASEAPNLHTEAMQLESLPKRLAF